MVQIRLYRFQRCRESYVVLLKLNIGIKHGFPCINVCQVPREMLKTEAVGLGFQHLPRDLANVNWKINFDRCYCINSTIYLLKFGKLYGTIFCHRLAVSERVHIF